MIQRILVCMLVMTAAVWAGPLMPCAAGTMASVIAQGPCSIGNPNFTFSSYQINASTDTFWADLSHPPVTDTPGTNSSPDATQVLFEPLGSALAPGFELTTAAGATPSFF